MNKTLKNKKTKNKTRKRVFHRSEYNNGDGFLTSTWGPPLWHVLHTISFNYPVNPTYFEQKQYKNFVTNLKYILPCKYCRLNLASNFKQLPITMKEMKNRETFSKYIYLLHENVNKMLKKKSNLTYCDVRERYEHFRSRCINKEIKQTKKKKEKGCTKPLYGKKSRCVMKIIPSTSKQKSLQIDKKCILK